MEPMMRYPNPDVRHKVRGPVQEITHEDGRIERRQLHIFTSRLGRHTTKIAPAPAGERALTQTTEGAETL